VIYPKLRLVCTSFVAATGTAGWLGRRLTLLPKHTLGPVLEPEPAPLFA